MRIVISIQRTGREESKFGIDMFAFRDDEEKFVRGLHALFEVIEWNVRRLQLDPSHKIDTPWWFKGSSPMDPP